MVGVVSVIGFASVGEMSLKVPIFFGFYPNSSRNHIFISIVLTNAKISNFVMKVFLGSCCYWFF